MKVQHIEISLLELTAAVRAYVVLKSGFNPSLVTVKSHNALIVIQYIDDKTDNAMVNCDEFAHRTN